MNALLYMCAYMTGFAKICTSKFSNLEDSQNSLQMPDHPETCRVCKVIILLLFLQILDLYAVSS